jgi:hypothetical protein
MSLRIQIIIGILLVLTLVGIILQVRKNKLNLRFALSWLLLVCMLLLLDIWPGLAGGLANAAGVEIPLNMLLFLGICFTLLLIFSLTKRVSKLTDETKRLTQEIAIMKEEFRTDRCKEEAGQETGAQR